MKATQWFVLSIMLVTLSGCALFKPKNVPQPPLPEPTLSGEQLNLSIREGWPLSGTNELSLYPASPLQTQAIYTKAEYLRITTLNGKTEMGGRLTDSNTVETYYTITQPITEITYEQPQWTGAIIAVEVCTPGACTSLDTGGVSGSLLAYFSGTYHYYVGQNYLLVRMFTETALYETLLTISYYDLDNKLADEYNGARRAKNPYDRTYQRKLEICYNMDVENTTAREACINAAEQENTITLQDACAYATGAYDNYLAIVSTLGANTQTLSWVKHNDTVYYAAQHSDNSYIGCENEDHIVSFNAYDCTTQEFTDILTYDNLASSRLNLCGVRLAGVLNDDKLVYATYSYEGPYCSVNEPYKIMNMETKDINQIRIVPENIEIAQGETGYFATLDLIDESRKLYAEITDIYNTTIGNAAECGAGQYTISAVSWNELELTWAFGYHAEQDQYDVYELTKKYTLLYSGGILSLK